MARSVVMLVGLVSAASAYITPDDLTKVEDDFSAIASMLGKARQPTAASSMGHHQEAREVEFSARDLLERHPAAYAALDLPQENSLHSVRQVSNHGVKVVQKQKHGHGMALDFAQNDAQDNVPVAPYGPQVRPKLVRFTMPEQPERSIMPLAGMKGVEYEKLPEPIVNLKDKYEMAEDEDVSMYQVVTEGPCVTDSLMPEADEMAKGSKMVRCGVVGSHQVGKSRTPGEALCPGSPYECSNNGVCREGNCVCTSEWDGDDCSNYRCFPQCDHRATCANGTCVCPSGWGGSLCEQRTCNPACTINGICEDATCICSPGYFGDQCEIAMCPGMPQCSGLLRGECDGTSGVCNCLAGWGGEDCSKVDLPCEPACQNQGVCNNGTCVCPPGYTGATCANLIPRNYGCEGGAAWEEFVSPLVRTCKNVFSPDPNSIDLYTARCVCPQSKPVWDGDTRQCLPVSMCGETLCGDMEIPETDEAILGIFPNKQECDTNASGTCQGCALSTDKVGVCYRAGQAVAAKMGSSVEVIIALERMGGTCAGDEDIADFEAILEDSNLGSTGLDKTQQNADGTTTVVHTVIVPPKPDFKYTPLVNLSSAGSLVPSGYHTIQVNCTGTYRVVMVLVDNNNMVDMFSDCLFSVEKPSCPGTPECNNNGVCDNTTVAPVCECNEGYTGAECDIAYEQLSYGNTVTTLPGGILTSLPIPADATTKVFSKIGTSGVSGVTSTVVKFGNTTDGFTTMSFFVNGTVVIERPDKTLEYITEHYRDTNDIDIVTINGTVTKKNATVNATIHTCPSNQIWQQCASGCMPSCRNPEPRCMPTCLESSCQCPIEAPLWDDVQKLCVVPAVCTEQSECPGVGAICAGNGYCMPWGEQGDGTGSRCVCFDGWSGSSCEIYKERKPRATMPTSGTTSEAIPCHFPFEYRGKEYYDCTTDYDTDGVEWCSTTFEWEGMWGLCAPRNTCPTNNGLVCGGNGNCFAGECRCRHGYTGASCEQRVQRWTNGTNSTKCAFPYIGPDNLEHYDCIRGTPMIDGDGDLVGYTSGGNTSTSEWCLTDTSWVDFSSFAYCLPKGQCGLCPQQFGTCDTDTGTCVCKPGRSGETCQNILSEAQILSQLFHDTKGLYWSRKGGWGAGTPPCGNMSAGTGPWSGLTCSGGKVTRIVLSAAGLVGIIPSELAGLQSLQVLDLSHNMLTGSVPAELTELPITLTSVILSDNHLTGLAPNFPSRVSYMDLTNNFFASGQLSSFDLAFAHRVTNGEGTAVPYAPCSFPFEFNGRSYLQCTTDFSESGEAWCSTDPVYSGSWGKCASPGTCAGSDGVQCTGHGACEIIYTAHGAGGKCNCESGWYGDMCDIRAVRVTKTTKTGVFEEHHGRKCQLPFAYEGNLYNDCTTEGSATGEPWCLLTKEWEREWGYCAPVGTCPGRDTNCSGHGSCNTDGTCSCDVGWIWDDCSHEVGRVTVGTYQPAGTPCHFPFTLGGVEYTNCTTAPTFQGEPYCAVMPGELEEHKQWDYCAPVGVCPGEPECSGDGLCVDGECVCDPGYTGPACGHEMSDRDILTKLFRSTGGQYWLQSGGWEEVHECQWFGITCNEAGRVTGISLPHNNLDGTLPVELSLIVTLLGLDLSGNYLAGTVPEKIGKLPQLQVMDVSNNEFVGKLPVFNHDVMKGLKCDNNCFEAPSQCTTKPTCLDRLRQEVNDVEIDCSMGPVGSALCDSNAICAERFNGSYACKCQSGYHGNGTVGTCKENKCRVPAISPSAGYIYGGDLKTNVVSGLGKVRCDRGYKTTGVGAYAPKATCASDSGDAFDFTGCEECPVGFYQPAQDAGKCLPCGPGTWSDEVASLYCRPCPMSTYSNRSALSSPDQCTKCPVGTHGSPLAIGKDSMPTACTMCQPGEYQDTKGSSECKLCESTEAEYQNDAGQSICDVDCHGVFEECGADCFKTFKVVMESQGNGNSCDHVDGFTATCADGEGLCAESSSATGLAARARAARAAR